jgi:signal transduction histidine kinase
MRVGRGSGVTAWDGLVAGASGFVMVIVALAYVTQAPQPSDTSAATTLGAVVVAQALLAFRSTRPRMVVAVAAIAAAVAAGTGFTVPVVALPLAVYSLVATTNAAWMSVVAIAGSGALLAVGHAMGSDDAGDLWVRDVALVVGAVAVGAWAQAHRRAGQRLAEADVARREAAHRLMVARELHELAAGTLTAVAVQAGAAAHLGEHRPAAARAMMGDVAAESRVAMAHLRSVAAALRAGEVSVPRPAATSVDALVSLYRRAGLDVRGSWDVGQGDGDGEGAEDEDGTVLVRLVVQEALTNVLRHAGRVAVDLSVCQRAGATVVEVTNPLPEPPPRGGGGPAGSGFGLVGLGERVEQAGGALEFGPDGGSFRVRAMLPYGVS